jgi:hypothetical protein
LLAAIGPVLTTSRVNYSCHINRLVRGGAFIFCR